MNLSALRFDGYWPWWLGALALATVASGYWLAMGSLFGVSGFWRRVLGWRAERDIERQEAALPDSDEAFRAALIEATREELGGLAAEPEPGASQPPALRPALIRRPPVSASATFLVMLIAGGLLASLVSGDFALRLELSPAFHALFGTGWTAMAVLLVGGILAGFGTALAGGCTSGHGLNGCARMQPGSLASTAAFFATGVAVSLLLAWGLG